MLCRDMPGTPRKTYKNYVQRHVSPASCAQPPPKGEEKTMGYDMMVIIIYIFFIFKKNSIYWEKN